MNATKLKSEMKTALQQIAVKYNVNFKVGKVEKSNDGLESTLMIVENKEKSQQSRRRTKTRKQQVQALMSKGWDSAKKIAKRIGTHQSYVSRLISEIKHEEQIA